MVNTTEFLQSQHKSDSGQSNYFLHVLGMDVTKIASRLPVKLGFTLKKVQLVTMVGFINGSDASTILLQIPTVNIKIKCSPMLLLHLN